MSSCGWALLVALVLAPVEQSLRETAREHGGAASNSINYFTPLTPVSTLMAQSDFVVHATVLNSKTLLIQNDMLVATDYTIVPLEVLKQRPSLNASARPGTPPIAAAVRRAGGTMAEGQYRYSTANTDIPEEEAPRVGDEVIWFLRYDHENAIFTFTAGSFAAFRVTDGQVKPQTRGVASRRGDVPVDLATFLRAMREQNPARH
jgi:hypothetical protein